SRRRHTSFSRDWSSDVCSSDLRNIHSNIHTTHHVLTTRLAHKNSVLFLDFAKAFDSMNHSYILLSLQKFGFPSSFIQIIQSLIKIGRASCRERVYIAVPAHPFM